MIALARAPGLFESLALITLHSVAYMLTMRPMECRYESIEDEFGAGRRGSSRGLQLCAE